MALTGLLTTLLSVRQTGIVGLVAGADGLLQGTSPDRHFETTTLFVQLKTNIHTSKLYIKQNPSAILLFCRTE